MKKNLAKRNLSIIIPAYREEKRIKRCIDESLSYFRNNKNINKFEIIFVADRTGDRTISIIQQYQKKEPRIRLIVNRHREQKGGSVKIGMLNSRYELMLFYDVDLSTPLKEVDKFLKYADKYDILIASREMKESQIKKQRFKSILSKGFSVLKRIMFNIKIKDTQCGFKMFHRNSLKIFKKQTLKTSHFDVEILYIAMKMHLTIKEIPVTWTDSDMSNFNWYRQVILAVEDLSKMKINCWKGRYDV